MKFRLMMTAVAATALVASPMPVLAETAEQANTDEAGPAVIPPPPAGKGQIVFFRPGGMGFALGCSVNEKGAKLSSLGAGRYFVLVTEPGRHEYTVKSESKDVLALEVEADETQFAKCRIKMGIIVGRPDLAPATEAEFRQKDKWKLVDDEDMGPGPGALRAADMAAANAPKVEVAAPAAAEPAPAAPAVEAPVVVAPAPPAEPK